jgi:hypothetical protein
MAQDKTYTDLLALVQALAGVDSFTTSEQTRLLAIANRRLYQAYNAMPTWPRYMIGAQARPMNDGVVAAEYDEATGVRSVSSATRSSTTVTIVTTAAVTFVAGMRVTIAGLSGTVTPNGTYTVTGVTETTVENDTFTYELDTTNTSTETYSGTGSVSPVAIADISDYHRIYSANPFVSGVIRDLNFWVDSDGAHVTGDHDGLEGIWVGYKKQWPGPYLSTATDIPLEFFYYAAHASYADFLRMDGYTDKAMAEEGAAQAYLQLEMEKAANSKNNNLAFGRFTTHNSTQSR